MSTSCDSACSSLQQGSDEDEKRKGIPSCRPPDNGRGGWPDHQAVSRKSHDGCVYTAGGQLDYQPSFPEAACSRNSQEHTHLNTLMFPSSSFSQTLAEKFHRSTCCSWYKCCPTGEPARNVPTWIHLSVLVKQNILSYAWLNISYLKLTWIYPMKIYS